MSSLKKLASQTAVYGLSSILGRLLNYLLVPLYTNVFNPNQYGVVTELYAYVSFIAVIMTYGMETAYFRYSQRDDLSKEKVYATALISIALSTCSFLLLGFYFSGQIAAGLHYEQHVWYINCFIVVIAIDAITALPFAQLRAQNKPLRFATIRLINIFINIFLNVFFIVICPRLARDGNTLINTWYEPQIGVGYIFIANLVSSVVTFLLLLPYFKIKWRLDKTLLREMLKYALPLLFVGLAGMINETADRVMLRYLLPAGNDVLAQTGIYGACYKISIIMTIFIQTFRYAAEPFFFSHAREGNAKETYARVMNYFVIACAVIFLATLLYLDIVKYFVGKKYWEGLKVVPLLLLANWCLGIYYNLTVWYKLTNKTMFGAWLSALGAVITLLLNVILIPRLGYFGAAITTLVCYALMMVYSYIQGQKHYPIPYQTGYNLLVIFGALVIYFVSTFWSELVWGLKISINTLCLMVFCGILFMYERKKATTLLK